MGDTESLLEINMQIVDNSTPMVIKLLSMHRLMTSKELKFPFLNSQTAGMVQQEILSKNALITLNIAQAKTYFKISILLVFGPKELREQLALMSKIFLLLTVLNLN